MLFIFSYIIFIQIFSINGLRYVEEEWNPFDDHVRFVRNIFPDGDIGDLRGSDKIIPRANKQSLENLNKPKISKIDNNISFEQKSAKRPHLLQDETDKYAGKESYFSSNMVMAKESKAQSPNSKIHQYLQEEIGQETLPVKYETISDSEISSARHLPPSVQFQIQQDVLENIEHVAQEFSPVKYITDAEMSPAHDLPPSLLARIHQSDLEDIEHIGHLYEKSIAPEENDIAGEKGNDVSPSDYDIDSELDQEKKDGDSIEGVVNHILRVTQPHLVKESMKELIQDYAKVGNQYQGLSEDEILTKKMEKREILRKLYENFEEEVFMPIIKKLESIQHRK